MESSDKKQKLEETMAELQDRWGSSAVQRLGNVLRSSIPHISTGFDALDEVLSIGGLPSGRISEIVGVPTSGMSTLALMITAHVQKQAGPAVYFDLDSNFDPEFADRCGLDLESLILIRPKDVFQSLHIMHDLVAEGGISLLVFDAAPPLFSESQVAKALATTLDRIIAPLSQKKCALLFLTSLSTSNLRTGRSPKVDYPVGSIIPYHASVRLHIQHEKWLYKDGDISGYSAQITVAKNKLGPAGRRANLSIQFGRMSKVKTIVAPSENYIPALAGGSL